jgi:hypothetical protein
MSNRPSRNSSSPSSALAPLIAAAISGASANDDTNCSFCGRKHPLAQCRGVQNFIAQHKAKQLNRCDPSTSQPRLRGDITKSFKRPSHYGGNGAVRGNFRGRRGGFHGNKRGDRGTHRVHFNRSASPTFVLVTMLTLSCWVPRRRESLAPPPFLVVFASVSKKKKIYIENLKKISYEPHRNFLQHQTSKNLSRKWSRFCKNIL